MKTKGELVTPKEHPELQSRVKEIKNNMDDEPLYLLENGTSYTENELE